MKRNRCFLTAMAFLLFFPWIGGPKKGSDFQPSPAVPSQIAEFYEDYNFVASFSTPSEREKLIDFFPRENLPANLASSRMKRIFRVMKGLYSRMVRTDPKMVIPVGPRTQYIKYLFLPQLLDIRKINLSDKKAVVEVCAYSVEPAFVNRFISDYEECGGEEGKIPPDKERIDAVKKTVVAQTEFHVWFLQNRKWMRTEYKNIYIKQ
jgi:hypothetical protein